MTNVAAVLRPTPTQACAARRAKDTSESDPVRSAARSLGSLTEQKLTFKKLSFRSDSVKVQREMTKGAETGSRRKPRRPTQARAAARRASLLDATARLLDGRGYEALTTNAVAAEANTAIGTVYQYFPSKEALLAGLLERHRDRLEAAIEGAVTEGAGDLLATADAAVDAFADVWRSEPGYRAAWAAKQAEGLLARTGRDWGDAFTLRVADLVGGAAPALGGEERRLIATTAVHLVSGLLLAAMTHAVAEEAELIGETKTALRAYLTMRLVGASTPEGGSQRTRTASSRAHGRDRR